MSWSWDDLLGTLSCGSVASSNRQGVCACDCAGPSKVGAPCAPHCGAPAALTRRDGAANSLEVLQLLTSGCVCMPEQGAHGEGAALRRYEGEERDSGVEASGARTSLPAFSVCLPGSEEAATHLPAPSHAWPAHGIPRDDGFGEAAMAATVHALSFRSSAAFQLVDRRALTAECAESGTPDAHGPRQHGMVRQHMPFPPFAFSAS